MSRVVQKEPAENSQFKRIFVVDPSLRDYVGHHYAYDKAILDTCAIQGIECEVLAHKDVGRYLPLEDRIAPVYSQDMWRQLKAQRSFGLAARVFTLRALQTILVIPVLATIFWSTRLAPFRAALRKAVMRLCTMLGELRRQIRQARRLVSSLLPSEFRASVKAALRPFAQALRIPRRAADTLVVRPVRAAISAFIQGIGFVLDNVSAPLWLLEAFLPNPEFYFETHDALRARHADKGDLVFCHMAFHAQLLEWALLALKSRRRSGEQFVLLLRYPVELYLPRSFRTRLALRALEQAWTRGNVRLATDSERLAHAFSAHTFIPMEVYPIPHAGSGDVSAVSVTGRPIRFVSLGNARAEKGILEIYRAIEILHADDDAAGLEFILQVNDPDALCKADTKAVMAKSLPGVRFVDAPLDEAAYAQLVEDSDVILVPYWNDVYASRTSGIFIEAVSAGKIVVASKGTWMADELERYGGGILVSSRSPEGLAEAIRTIRDRVSELASEAAAAAMKCRDFHSPQRFIDALVKGKGVFPRTRSAAVLYPWNNFLTRASGASLRTALLMDVIESKGYRLNILMSSSNQVQAPPDRYRVFRFPDEDVSASINRLLCLFVGSIRFGTFGRSRPAEWILYLYTVWHRRRRFRLAVNRALRGCQVLFLEYTFLASVVAPIARCYGIPVVISEHDVMANQAPWPPLRRRLLALETRSLRLADWAVCVSEDDRAIFRSHGVDAQVVANSVRVSDLRIPTADEAKKTILHAGIALPESYVLFIGSAYGPNNSAADFLHQLSRTFARRGIDLSVVVAGTCHTPLADGLFHSLGLVSEEVKAALYVLARAVVAPLVGGTGTSLKIVEAMSMGKVVIGTNSAFRGLGVTHGENALLEDDLSSYDRLLPQFLEDTDRFLHMAREARKLAGQFDYRLTYRHYVDYLESLDVAPVGTVRGVAGWQR